MRDAKQRKWVIARLRENGEITRNGGYEYPIGRLAPIIQVLEAEGWEFQAFYRKTERGLDYVYRVLKDPRKKQVVTRLPNGSVSVSYV